MPQLSPSPSTSVAVAGLGPRTRRRDRRLVATWIALAVLVVSLPMLRFGIGTSNDSVTYMAEARNVRAGDGFVSFDGVPVTEFPPLYPALLAGGEELGGSGATVAWLLNVVSMVALGVATWAATRAVVASRAVRHGAVVGVLLGLSTSYVCSWAWSDGLFLALSFAAIAGLERWVRDQRPAALLLATAMATAACLDRYAGALLVAAGALAIMVAPPRRRDRWVAFVPWVALPAAATAAWLARNRAIGDGTSAAGDREEARAGLAHNALAELEVLGRFIVGHLPDVLTAVVAVAATTVLVRRRRALVRRVPVMTSFVAVYAVGLVIIASRTGISTPNVRLLAPVFAPAVVLGAVLMDDAARFERRAGAAWLAATVVATVVTSSVHLSGGIGGYSTARWERSPVIAAAKSAAIDGPVVSNRPEVVALRLDRHVVRMASWRGEPGTFVWIGDGSPPAGRVLARAADGLLLQVGAGAGS